MITSLCLKKQKTSVTIYSLDEQRQMKHSISTGIQSTTLGKNEEIRLLTWEMEDEFPLLLSANFLGVTPLLLPNLANLEGDSERESL